LDELDPPVPVAAPEVGPPKVKPLKLMFPLLLPPLPPLKMAVELPPLALEVWSPTVLLASAEPLAPPPVAEVEAEASRVLPSELWSTFPAVPDTPLIERLSVTLAPPTLVWVGPMTVWVCDPPVAVAAPQLLPAADSVLQVSTMFCACANPGTMMARANAAEER